LPVERRLDEPGEQRLDRTLVRSGKERAVRALFAIDEALVEIHEPALQQIELRECVPRLAGASQDRCLRHTRKIETGAALPLEQGLEHRARSRTIAALEPRPHEVHLDVEGAGIAREAHQELAQLGAELGAPGSVGVEELRPERAKLRLSGCILGERHRRHDAVARAAAGTERESQEQRGARVVGPGGREHGFRREHGSVPSWNRQRPRRQRSAARSIAGSR
jgi:hypothetical protein